jgi:hypothetical protein
MREPSCATSEKGCLKSSAETGLLRSLGNTNRPELWFRAQLPNGALRVEIVQGARALGRAGRRSSYKGVFSEVLVGVRVRGGSDCSLSS